MSNGRLRCIEAGSIGVQVRYPLVSFSNWVIITQENLLACVSSTPASLKTCPALAFLGLPCESPLRPAGPDLGSGQCYPFTVLPRDKIPGQLLILRREFIAEELAESAVTASPSGRAHSFLLAGFDCTTRFRTTVQLLQAQALASSEPVEKLRTASTHAERQ